MVFANPSALILLLFIPIVLYGQYYWEKRKSGTLLYSHLDLVKKIKPTLKFRLRHLLKISRVTVIILLVLTLARPQRIDKESETFTEGIDIVVALDMSGSMHSIDISNEDLLAYQRQNKIPDNRFQIAKKVLEDFIIRRKTDRLGMIIFGKEAYTQFPLTLDYSVILNILESLNLNDIDGDGTALGDALAVCINRLRDSTAKTKIIILITDGKQEGEKISSLEMANYAKLKGIMIFPILVGSPEQSRILTGRSSLFGLQFQRVQHPTDPEALKKIAAQSKGKFYRAVDKKELSTNLHEILSSFEKSKIQVDEFAYENYPYFLFPALFLLFLEILLSLTVFRKFP